MMKEAITKNSLLLAAFALFVAAGLAATEINTRAAREASLRAVKSKALEAIVPAAEHDNILLDDSIPVNDTEFLKLKNEMTIHIARMNGQITAFIFPVRATDGYGGAIDSIVGIRTDGTLAGARVITHAETPGLGDKIELKKSPWILAFNGKSLDNLTEKEWAVKKDKGVFDQFTGATITPRAVVSSIHNTLKYFQANKTELFEKAKNSQVIHQADANDTNQQPAHDATRHQAVNTETTSAPSTETQP